MTLAFEDANSKLSDVFCVAVVDSLVEKLKLKFGKDLEENFWLVNTLSQKFGQDLEAEVWSRF